jgi:hypothetical protein
MLGGFKSGLFDKESLSLLRRVSSQPDKVAAYEHVHDTLLLRSATLSTSIEIPKGSSFSQAEVLFGEQKGMYKNADLVLQGREKASAAATSLQMIAKARIEQNIAKIGSMTHVIKHGEQVQKEVAMPSSEKKDGEDEYHNKTEEQVMQIRLHQSRELAKSTGRLPRPLDMEQLQALTEKVNIASDMGPEYERLREVRGK